MNEISFYEEFSKKFKKYLVSYLDDEFKVFYSCNKTLDNIINELENISGFKIKPDNIYIPKLKLDIVFAICKENHSPRLILIEAKYLPQLSLKDYSQLVGYLQVAKIINVGLLLLIKKGYSNTNLSNDFREIIELEKLPMDWLIHIKNANEKHRFKTGIIYYVPDNGIDWIDTRNVGGLSSFEDIANSLL